MSLETVRSLCRDVADKYKALANEFRVLILAVLLVLGETKWSFLKRKLEKIVETKINPNLLAFHLRKLVKAGYVERITLGNEIIYRLCLPSEIEHNIMPVANNIRELIKEKNNYDR